MTTIIEGKAGRGISRTSFMKQIIEDIGQTDYKELKIAKILFKEFRFVTCHNFYLPFYQIQQKDLQHLSDTNW